MRANGVAKAVRRGTREVPAASADYGGCAARGGRVKSASRGYHRIATRSYTGELPSWTRAPATSARVPRGYTAEPPPSALFVFQRFIYTLTLYLLMPFVVYRLAARGFKYHGYFARWRERFGFFPDPGVRDSIWIHAVSLGEVNAAVPLIEALMRRYRDSQFVITTVTPTGSEGFPGGVISLIPEESNNTWIEFKYWILPALSVVLTVTRPTSAAARISNGIRII